MHWYKICICGIWEYSFQASFTATISTIRFIVGFPLYMTGLEILSIVVSRPVCILCVHVSIKQTLPTLTLKALFTLLIKCDRNVIKCDRLNCSGSINTLGVTQLRLAKDIFRSHVKTRIIPVDHRGVKRYVWHLETLCLIQGCVSNASCVYVIHSIHTSLGQYVKVCM